MHKVSNESVPLPVITANVTAIVCGHLGKSACEMTTKYLSEAHQQLGRPPLGQLIGKQEITTGGFELSKP